MSGRRGTARKRAPRRAAGHAAAPRSRPAGFAVLTVSDTRRGSGDTSGALVEKLAEGARHRVLVRGWVADEPAAIRRAARQALARDGVDVLVVTGGTGAAPRDRTPEALAPLIERGLPGFGELFRLLSVDQVGTAAWLSRAMAGIAAGKLVVLLPGARAAVELGMKRLLLPELGHVLRMLGRLEPKE
ncbi:MAG: molybdenum cofactor biosynthesis protein MoaB [Candidatus Eisenbacteria bacterium]|nr:molybdenum cofactor biosynthesis protein MoaB [Candidatus Eisenbacteria bacterium]